MQQSFGKLHHSDESSVGGKVWFVIICWKGKKCSKAVSNFWKNTSQATASGFVQRTILVPEIPLGLSQALRRELLREAEFARSAQPPSASTPQEWQRSCFLGTRVWQTLDLFWHVCLWDQEFLGNLFLFWYEQLFIRSNGMHIRHSLIAAGGVQESLITVALGVDVFLLVCSKPPQFQWDLQGIGTPGYWGFCCVKYVNIKSRVDSKDAPPGRRLYGGGITAWVFLVWKHCLEGWISAQESACVGNSRDFTAAQERE